MSTSSQIFTGGLETQAEATAWIDAVQPRPAPLVILIGSGLGFALEALEQRNGGVRAVVVEPDPNVADAFLRRRDWGPWLAANRLALLVGPEYTGAVETARRFPDVHAAPALEHPQLVERGATAVAQARLTVSRLRFQANANDGARRASAGRYLLHTLANVPRLARESDVAALPDLGKGLPAVIAAAGPSLDANVHDLAPVRDRAVLIACDTAARVLLANDLDPEFIVATDSSRANAGHLSSLPPSRSWLVAEGSLHPSAFVHFDGRAFVFNVSNHQPWPWLKSIGLERGKLGTWGSVATSAFALALALGMDPIIFIGADFAFTDGRPYCRGTSFETLWATWAASGSPYSSIWQTLVDRWPAAAEPDLHGQPAATAQHLVSFRDWIVERAKNGGRSIVNATAAGLLHGGGIAQQSATAVLAGRPPVPAGELQARLQAAHAAARGDLGRTLHAVGGMLRTPSHPERNAWIEFSGGSVSATAIDAALRSHEYVAWELANRTTASKKDLD